MLACWFQAHQDRTGYIKTNYVFPPLWAAKVLEGRRKTLRSWVMAREFPEKSQRCVLSRSGIVRGKVCSTTLAIINACYTRHVSVKLDECDLAK